MVQEQEENFDLEEGQDEQEMSELAKTQAELERVKAELSASTKE